MYRTTWLWRILGLVTLASTLILLAGFAWALKDNWFPSSGMALPEASPPPAASGGSLESKPEIKIAALGDSLTVGTGDATGNGYVKTAAAELSKAMGKPVRVVNNLAIGGLRADQLLPHLNDKGYRTAIAQSDIVLMTIGGNDLFQLAQSGSASMTEGGDISVEQVEKRLPEAEKRLQNVLAAVRKLNPVARIVYIGLYNPFYDLDKLRPASRTIAEWNAFAQGLAAADGNATVVPTYDLFESGIGRYLSSDHFHPNEAGYARIAERVVQALH